MQLFVDAFGGAESEGKAGREGELFTAQIGREMSGVREADGAAGFEVRAEAGGEAAHVASVKDEVEVREEFGGRVGGAAVGGADEKGCGHGSGSAFAADVADKDALTAIGQRAAEIEVAADIAHGPEGDLDTRAGGGVERGGGEDALDLLGGLHFAGEDGALLGGAAVFAEEQCHQRNDRHDGAEGAKLEKEGPPPIDA